MTFFEPGGLYFVIAFILSNFYLVIRLCPSFYPPFVLFFVYLFLVFLILNNERVGCLRHLWPLYLFLATITLSCFWSDNAGLSVSALVVPIHQLFFSLFVALLLKKRGLGAIQHLVWLTAVVGIIFTVFFYFQAGSLRGVKEFYGAGGRSESFGNVIASMLILMTPLLLYYGIFSKLWGKLFNYLLIVCSVLIVIMSGSRQAVVLLFFMLLFILLLACQGRVIFFRIIRIILFAAFSLSAVLFFLPEGSINIFDRFGRLVEDFGFLWGADIDGLSERGLIWRAGVELISDHPFFGIGWGMFSEYFNNNYGRYMGSHNLVVAVWGGAGLLGLFSLLILSFMTIVNPFLFFLMSVKEKDFRNQMLFAIIIVGLLSGYGQFMVRNNWSNSIFFIFLVMSLFSRHLYCLNKNYF